MDFSLLIRWDRVALLCGFCIDSAAAEGILFCHVKVRKKTRVWPPPFSVGFGKTTQKMMPAVGRRGGVERLAERRQLLGMWSRRFTLTRRKRPAVTRGRGAPVQENTSSLGTFALICCSIIDTFIGYRDAAN